MNLHNPYLDDFNKIYLKTYFNSMEMVGNPDLDIDSLNVEIREEIRLMADKIGTGNCGFAFRRSLLYYYSFAVPDDRAIEIISKYAPVVEIGAGSGYWSYMLSQNGIQVKAFDNQSWHEIWKKQWFDVQDGDEKVLRNYPERSLLMCWPNYNEPFASNCLKNYKGKNVIYIGEGFDGCTGDDAFHKTLDNEWKIIDSHEIPTWDGIHDQLEVYERI